MRRAANRQRTVRQVDQLQQPERISKFAC